MQPSFFSTVGEVLVVVAREPDFRVREIALTLGITERTVINALRVLEDSRVVTVHRNGRRNHYRVNLDATIHVGPSKAKVGRLLAALEAENGAGSKARDHRATRTA